MKAATESNPQTDVLPSQQMSRLGMELVMKATLCAAMVALVAGMLAALLGA